MEELMTANERERLLAAGDLGLDDDELVPLVRLFQPDGPGVWLIAELDRSDADLAYGLADIGVGAPEAGTFSLGDVAALKGRLGLGVERDRGFATGATLAELGRWATAAGRIVR